jgi:hypothetical protein
MINYDASSLDDSGPGLTGVREGQALSRGVLEGDARGGEPRRVGRARGERVPCHGDEVRREVHGRQALRGGERREQRTRAQAGGQGQPGYVFVFLPNSPCLIPQIQPIMLGLCPIMPNCAQL